MRRRCRRFHLRRRRNIFSPMSCCTSGKVRIMISIRRCFACSHSKTAWGSRHPRKTPATRAGAPRPIHFASGAIFERTMIHGIFGRPIFDLDAVLRRGSCRSQSSTRFTTKRVRRPRARDRRRIHGRQSSLDGHHAGGAKRRKRSPTTARSSRSCPTKNSSSWPRSPTIRKNGTPADRGEVTYGEERVIILLNQRQMRWLEKFVMACIFPGKRTSS